MPIDRAATLRQAEKLLRQGKVDQAIAEYVRLVEDQPSDWNTANVLGDLYVRAGHLDRAIEQFSRVAGTLAEQGFLPKASAVYKKILKLKPDADHAFVQAGELASQQGLLADARTLFAAAAQGRRTRGDVKGALEIVVRVGSLDRKDVDARLAAARARLDLDDLPGALHEFSDLAAMLVEEGRDGDAIVPLSEVASRDPGNAHAARELARILVARGRDEEAAQYLTPDVLGKDAGLLAGAAGQRFRSGEFAAGMELVDALFALDEVPGAQIAELGLSLIEQQPDASYAVLSRLVDSETAAGKWTEAADLLTDFVSRLPHHIDALAQLVEVCVDGGLEERTVEAQSRLADAYLESGAASEAKYVAEDLLTRQPSDTRHIARLRSALALKGAEDPDQAVADWLAERGTNTIESDPIAEAQGSERPPAVAAATEPRTDEQDAGAAVQDGDQTMPVPGEPVQPRPAATVGDIGNPHSIDLDLIFGTPAATMAPPAQAVVPAARVATPQAHTDTPPADTDTPPAQAAPPSSTSVEEDLSVALDQFQAAPPVAAPAQSAAPPPEIESVLAQFRDEAEHQPKDDPADVAYTRGLALLEAGELEASIEPLRTAARSPARRFAAATLLARVYQQQNATAKAIEWLGHAVDAPATSAQERFETLFQLAELLELSGEREGALALFLELQVDAGEYKDITRRISRLSRTEGGG